MSTGCSPHQNRVGDDEFLQEGDELAVAVALSDGMVNNVAREVDGSAG
jgi:hypothetical protein